MSHGTAKVLKSRGGVWNETVSYSFELHFLSQCIFTISTFTELSFIIRLLFGSSKLTPRPTISSALQVSPQSYGVKVSRILWLCQAQVSGEASQYTHHIIRLKTAFIFFFALLTYTLKILLPDPLFMYLKPKSQNLKLSLIFLIISVFMLLI